MTKKIKALTRPIEAYQPAGSAHAKVPRNLDAKQHPLERAREYKRALNAVKLERLHAAPFICQLGEGHVDGVYTLAKDPKSLEHFASGSGDGVLKVWNLPDKTEVWQTKAHENIIKSCCWTLDKKLLSCAADRAIRLFDPYNTTAGAAPLSTWLTDAALTSISHHRTNNAFAAASSVVSVYDLERHSAAPEVLQWPTSADTINAVAFNPVETSVLASCATDRSVVLYDLRMSSPLAKSIHTFVNNAISWNPQIAFNFALASENHDINIFDMRKLDRALNVLKGHVAGDELSTSPWEMLSLTEAAVMDVEFSPTGEELVSASYDRTIRLWNVNQGHSRDVYHTKRMQRVFSCKFTPDSKYVISGSDDGNLRLWRSEASRREGIQSTRQRQALEYNRKLMERYAHMFEIRRIKRHRHLPMVIKKAGEIKAEELKAIKRREENRRKHSKLRFEKRRSEREKMVIAQEE